MRGSQVGSEKTIAYEYMTGLALGISEYPGAYVLKATPSLLLAEPGFLWASY